MTPPPVVPDGDAGTGASGNAPDGQATKNKKLLPIIIAIVAVVALLVIGLTVFLTYRAEVWGGKSLPDTSAIAKEVTDKSGKKKSVVKAKDVTAALENKGFKVKTTPVFSGEDSGTFLGYQGVKQGSRVKAGSTVTIQESAGPGVPKDTIGKKAQDVVNTFSSMGVPVHYKKVVIAQDSKTPEGQVGVTYPEAGTALPEADRENGIYIGVTSKGDGISVDILGADKDKAVSALQSQGYTVDLEPHYSSKQYVGKISGSYPAPGSALSSGASVTLYYGVDKSSNMDLLSQRTDDGLTIVKNNATPMIGMYCKSEVKDQSKDCITLEATQNTYGESAGGGFMSIKGHEPSSLADNLGLGNYSQDVSGVMLKPGAGVSADKLPLANNLITKDWGMFELYAGADLPNCGSTPYASGPGKSCVNGTVQSWASMGNTTNYTNTGMTYEMKDFLVYFPVGSDVKALEDSGYFDSDSLTVAKKQKTVDTDRPFIVMRDSSQYSKTSVPYDATSTTPDPFVPTNRYGVDNTMVKMKPAPSDSSVYYLVEQNGDLDWDSMPDADIKVPESKDSTSAKQDPVFKEAMAKAAGEYGLGSGAGAWGSGLKINEDGTFSGSYSDSDMGLTGDGYPNGSRSQSDFTGKFKSATKNSDGTYTLQCDASAFKIDGTVGSSSIENGVKITVTKPVGMETCEEFKFYPDPTDFSQFDDQMKMWSGGRLMSDDTSGATGKALVNTKSEYEYTFYDFDN
ncbi:PASTA domain-containing protein [Bifidobacterium sp. LC6]|uniref:PASTA domain-containing protein n=2 Tax=Bifidobacterium colobi TaxID=2809026 RepID=A0ABS5UTA0_9BIFI|nr:PASTA domain-containing protein [Bifidobacterium colobi]